MVPKTRSNWKKVGDNIFFALFIVALFVFIIAPKFGISWTGFLSWPIWTGILNWCWTGVRTKTSWDVLQLLIVPIMLAFGAFCLNGIQKRREEKTTEQRAEIERKASEMRAQTDRDIATDNQREKSLQDYIDRMSELLLKENLHKSDPEDVAREVARVRTLTVLSRLDRPRKESVLKFLHESGLIDKDKHIIDLHGGNLSAINFSEAALCGVNLCGVDLHNADLRNAKLGGANLSETDLMNANLSGATLSEADLHGANLSGVNLSRADLNRSDLSGVWWPTLSRHKNRLK